MWKYSKNIAAIAMAAATIFITVAACRTIHIFEVLTFHGPSGQPLVLGSFRGVLYFAVSDVHISNSPPWSVNDERWPSLSLQSYVDFVAGSADWQAGYRVTPDTPTTNISAVPKWYGFSIAKGSNALNVPNTWYLFASLPAWFAGPLLAVYPLRRSFFFLRSRRRRRRGLCPVCAYDLRQSPQRCPECGVAR